MIVTVGGYTPVLADDAWVAPDAVLAGQVRLATGASVWYTAVLRGDDDWIDIGPDSNIQDGCVLHPDRDLPVLVGRGVSVGHRAILHGCVVADHVLVGMGATVLNGCRIGTGSLVAAGAVLREGTEVPPGSLVAGVPGQVRRTVTAEELDKIRRNAVTYRGLAQRYAASEVKFPATAGAGGYGPPGGPDRDARTRRP